MLFLSFKQQPLVQFGCCFNAKGRGNGPPCFSGPQGLSASLVAVVLASKLDVAAKGGLLLRVHEGGVRDHLPHVWGPLVALEGGEEHV